MGSVLCLFVRRARESEREMGCASSVAAAPLYPATSSSSAPAFAPKAAGPAATSSTPERKKASHLPAPTSLPRADTGLFEKELAGHKLPAVIAETPTIKEVAAARRSSVELAEAKAGPGSAENAPHKTFTKEVYTKNYFFFLLVLWIDLCSVSPKLSL